MATWDPAGTRTVVPVAQIPNRAILEERMRRVDEPGAHMWVMTAAWRIDPVAMLEGTTPVLMDAENLVMAEGPGCFKCERRYTRRLARQPCKGASS